MAGDLQAIPRELRELPQWVLYRIVVRIDKDGKAKPTKVPYQVAHGTRQASSTDPSTWASFEDAIAAHGRRRTSAGIGFVFSPDDPYAGVDLDKCRNPATGELHPEAEAIVSELDGYTEVSPSGTGLHDIVRGEIGKGRHRTKDTPWGGEFEIYDRARFFVMTGLTLPGRTVATIPERLEQLAALRARLLPESEPAAQTSMNGSAIADDRELLERAFKAKNGAKVRRLWSGDISGYASDSEADCALCAMLAFWTGPDKPRIARLFQSSGLMREKWDREDYRDDTIDKALEGRTEFYESRPSGLRAAEKVPADNPLLVASTLIGMVDTPLSTAVERRGGKVVLERADGMTLDVSSLSALAKYDRLAAELGAQFGHELTVEKGEGTRTAVRFVAALRRHFGPGQSEHLEERIEGWMVELALAAGEIPFDHGDAESKLYAWKALDAADPEAERGARAFALKVMLAHDTSTDDRYLQAGWAQEYLRRRGLSVAPDVAAGLLEALGLRQPNSDGRVRARWRAGGQTLQLRFWIIPGGLFEAWTT